MLSLSTLTARRRHTKYFPFLIIKSPDLITLALTLTLQGVIIGPKGSGKRFAMRRLAELFVKENLDNVKNILPFENDVFKMTCFDEPTTTTTSNVETFFDDFEANVTSTRNKNIKKSVVAIFENVERENLNILSRLTFNLQF